MQTISWRSLLRETKPFRKMIILGQLLAVLAVLVSLPIPLMFPLHVLSEMIKPISLSLRLFGNIFGEDILLAVFVGLGAFAFIPLQTPFYFLALLTSFIQTMVFTLLACSYIQSFSHVHESH